MDELWTRIGLVVTILAFAGLIVLMQRRRHRVPDRDIEAPRLDPGLYLFSSITCSTCEVAREKLIAGTGEEGFHEYVWERDPEVFTELGIDAVPAVLVMREGGRGRLYPGRVDKALANR
jgi:hypothetical protein